ncbi:MAG: nucleoside deaminase [Armatimonadota bacterium]
MRMAIEKAREGIAEGQTPFGAVIVKDGRVVACEHNAVWATTDITAHAEIRAIRDACRVLGSVDLSGCVIYSTCEPCPMCFAACHWARIERVVYGAVIADAERAGFHELSIPNAEMKRLGGSPVELSAGVLGDEAAALFDEWLAAGLSASY